ncbi:hypothetical protein GX51_02030 [Blastomyces parvus]|uniref:RING-type domain-containing protein n=1 Tax=Blastomyces parvus TaxID=2060905 RepID=A0A2B7XE03_9EURO|nr:hypothetical protein GX51_02030 [Blastomyces parvus]
MKRKLTEIIDLTDDGQNGAIKVPRSSGGVSHPPKPQPRPTSPQHKYDQIYARIATIFPNISFKYVGQLYKRLAFVNPAGDVEAALVNHIMDSGPYPKEEEQAEVAKLEKLPQNIPRKSPQSASSKRVWGKGDGVIRSKSYYRASQYLLEQQFSKIPPDYVCSVLKSQKSLFAAFASLSECESTYNMTNPPLYQQRNNKDSGKPERPPDIPMNSDLLRELQDAKEERRKREESRRREKALGKWEAEKEAVCIAQGNVMECQCCYTDVPIIHMIPCAGENIHFFCRECVRSTAKSQIGVMKYEVNCMDISGCGASFDKQILAKVLGEPLMKKLEQLQQRDEIARAELEGLHDCPFCDFKAICPPIEMGDCQFYCQNPACRKVSCRRCGLEAHAPKTCEQANDKNTPARQKIEEAMSEALIRTCPNPKCKVKIIKEDGCNKMTCVKCRSVMCYVCKKAITEEGYRHFGKRPNNCPLHDDRSNARHFEEVSSAHTKAIEELKKANPQLNIEELAVEAPKNEHQNKSTENHAYLQHLRNQQRHYNDLLRRRRNRRPPAHPAQPGAAGPGGAVGPGAPHAPMNTAVNPNNPFAAAYPQGIPAPNGANQPLHFRGDMERMNPVEQPPHLPHQPIVQQDPHGNFHFFPPGVVPVPAPFPHVPNVHPQQNNHGHHHHYHYHYNHLGHPMQAGHANQGAPMPQQQGPANQKHPSQNQHGNQNQHLRLNQPQNPSRNTNQAQQHPQPQPQEKTAQGPPRFQIHPNHRFPPPAAPPAPQLKNPERPPKFRIHPNHRFPPLAPAPPRVMPAMPMLPNSFGPNPFPNPPPQQNQQPNRAPVMPGVPEKTQARNQTASSRPSPLLAQPTHMQAGTAVPGRHRHIASINNININDTSKPNNNNNNNKPHHINRPMFRYPVDVPDRAPREFPQN